MALPTCDDLVGCFQDGFTFPEAGCAAETNTGEVQYLYIGSSVLSSGTTAEFTSRVDNTGAAANHIVRISLRGQIPEPERPEFQVEGGVTVYGTPTYNFEGEFFDDGDEAYELYRKSYCNKPSLVWLGTEKHILGGNSDWKTGISTVVSVNRVMEGPDTLARYVVRFSWKSVYPPVRTINPDPLTGNLVT